MKLPKEILASTILPWISLRAYCWSFSGSMAFMRHWGLLLSMTVNSCQVDLGIDPLGASLGYCQDSGIYKKVLWKAQAVTQNQVILLSSMSSQWGLKANVTILMLMVFYLQMRKTCCMCLYWKKNGENTDGVQSTCKMIHYSRARRESEQGINGLFIFPSIMEILSPRQICRGWGER